MCAVESDDAGLMCETLKPVDAREVHDDDRKPSVYTGGLRVMRCGHTYHWISICFGCDSARFLMITVSTPFSIFATSVFGSAISGRSALIA